MARVKKDSRHPNDPLHSQLGLSGSDTAARSWETLGPTQLTQPAMAQLRCRCAVVFVVSLKNVPKPWTRRRGSTVPYRPRASPASHLDSTSFVPFGVSMGTSDLASIPVAPRNAQLRSRYGRNKRQHPFCM
ncbi:hypothetical protein N657DRAFT_36346 [Parathielavia appendiculata]|uniref:Uncharacterized protein n=1 Tax=Parathielavia appendiculata TaxID=2587402 RepID=A0AAN6U9G3_9PEZI|nr:hypothetical protein N657DRAFT_36346 [Parathielavia appendiculata]